MIPPKPLNLEFLENFVLKIITFDNKETKLYDMKPLLTEKFYEKLNNVASFKIAKVNGIRIEWKDLETDELYFSL